MPRTHQLTALTDGASDTPAALQEWAARIAGHPA
jgi:hypothetical protein